MIYFYMRVSTQGIRGNGKEQTFERQEGVFEGHGFVLTEGNVFSDHISGSFEGNKRDGYNAMLKVLKEGDTVCFTETSRFARNYTSAMNMIDELTQNLRVNVRFVSNGIELAAGEKYNPYTWFMVSQMLLMDEFQRRQIGFNTSNTLRKKAENGEVLGRREKFDETAKSEIREEYKTMPLNKIAEKHGCSAGTIRNIVKEGK